MGWNGGPICVRVERRKYIWEKILLANMGSNGYGIEYLSTTFNGAEALVRRCWTVSRACLRKGRVERGLVRRYMPVAHAICSTDELCTRATYGPRTIAT